MAMTTMERSKMIKIGTIIPRPAILVVFVTEVAEMHLKHKILLSSYHINGAHSNGSGSNVESANFDSVKIDNGC